MARRKNPSNFVTGLISVAAGFVGLIGGYAMCRGALKSTRELGAQRWNWWFELDDTGNYIPYIQSPTGEIFTLSPETTSVSATWSAEDAIKERGGTPVEGRPTRG